MPALSMKHIPSLINTSWDDWIGGGARYLSASGRDLANPIYGGKLGRLVKSGSVTQDTAAWLNTRMGFNSLRSAQMLELGPMGRGTLPTGFGSRSMQSRMLGINQGIDASRRYGRLAVGAGVGATATLGVGGFMASRR